MNLSIQEINKRIHSKLLDAKKELDSIKNLENSINENYDEIRRHSNNFIFNLKTCYDLLNRNKIVNKLDFINKKFKKELEFVKQFKDSNLHLAEDNLDNTKGFNIANCVFSNSKDFISIEDGGKVIVNGMIYSENKNLPIKKTVSLKQNIFFDMQENIPVSIVFSKLLDIYIDNFYIDK